MTDAVLVLTTLPTADAAAQIAKAVVGEKLAACANILPALRSIYRWEGKIQDENEVLVLLKTQRTHLARLTARILELHPYEVPEVLAIPVDQASGVPGLDRPRDGVEQGAHAHAGSVTVNPARRGVAHPRRVLVA